MKIELCNDLYIFISDQLMISKKISLLQDDSFITLHFQSYVIANFSTIDIFTEILISFLENLLKTKIFYHFSIQGNHCGLQIVEKNKKKSLFISFEKGEILYLDKLQCKIIVAKIKKIMKIRSFK